MRKKNRILNICIILTFLIAVLIIFSSGATYRLHTNQYAPGGKLDKVKITYDKEGIVANNKSYMTEDNEIVFSFTALERGSTHVLIDYIIRYPDGKQGFWNTEVDLDVWWFDLILDRTYGSFNAYNIAIYAFLTILIMVEMLMLLAFITYRKRGEFSYEMITAGSISLFNAVLLLFTIYKLTNHSVRTFRGFVDIVVDISQMMLLILVPLMLIMSVFLIISNILLMCHEGVHPINCFGIVFGILWLSGTLVTLEPSILPFELKIPASVSWMLIYILCYFECLFTVTVLSSYMAVQYRPKGVLDYIIILGCGLRRDGTLTPLLQGRVDAAIEFDKKQFEKTGKHALFVPSGGQGPDEIMPEAEAMRRYLLEKNIPDDQILPEKKSKSTLENLKYSKVLIGSHCGNIHEMNIGFATTNYHIFRGYILTAKCGFSAKGISARTKAYFFPNAYLREFAGLLADKWWMHLMNIGFITIYFLSLRWITNLY